MPSSYHQAIAGLSATEKAQIAATLSRWEAEAGHGRMIVPNIYAERFLHRDRMIKILTRLHSASPFGFSVSALEREYRDECHCHSLQGGPVRCQPLPLLFGRAVERKVFERYLRGQKYCVTMREAKDFVQRRLDGHPPSAFESKHMMSPFGAWVTWSQASPDKPFDFVYHGLPNQLRACQVRAALGLEDDTGELLLLVYKLPPETALCRPTIADAALSYYFQPPAATNAHGVTRPWSNLRGIMAISTYTPNPRPEGVHCPVRMDNLEHLWRLR